MAVEPRKPVITTSGMPANMARFLEPVKQAIEMITGARSGIREIKGLEKSATSEEIIEKVNELARRLNASGKC